MNENIQCPVCGSDLVECPKCHKVVINRAAVRQGAVGDLGIIDIGWKCSACGHEWGFEMLKGGAGQAPRAT